VRGRLRASFAAKLLAAMLSLGIILIGGVFTYLVISRDHQANGAALSNSDNRSAVLAQVVVNFTGGQSLSAAQSLAAQPAMVSALSGPDAAAQARALFERSSPVDLSGEIVMVADANGQAAADVVNSSLPASLPASVRATLNMTGHCVLHGPGGTACGIELLGDQPAFDVAVPVVTAGRPIGVVAYLAPLQSQLGRYHALLDYPVAFVDQLHSDTLVRFGDRGVSPAAAPAALNGAFSPGRAGTTPVHGIYGTAAGDQVAGSFLPLAGPDGKVAGWIGVEAPLSQFVGDTKTDEVTLALIALLAILVTTVLVVVFVARVVWRPISRLERGVARIAGGDYNSTIMVKSKDELGRLGQSVERMQAQIKKYVSEIERSRAKVDRAVDRMSDLSRALTGTAAGVASLESAVVVTAAAIGGEGCSAWMAIRDRHELVLVANQGAPGNPMPDRLSHEATTALLRGETVHFPGGSRTRTLLAVPMFFNDEVVGALAIVGPGGANLATERDVLVVLANNAAIARENARLFEQERATVQRLRELDAMKSDFLCTVQHELRTPLTAILGLSDLIEMCWQMWDDSPKLEAVRDIQVAAKNLYDIVETIIDFTAMEGENLGLNPQPVAVLAAVDQAVVAVGERYKGGISVPLEVAIASDLQVYADQVRFDQLLRALIDNAVKFSDGRGRVRISADLLPTHMVRLTIADIGIGIPQGEVSRVFDRFYQVDHSATRRFGGTGMGLALVRRLAIAHGALVELESRLGEGTTVTIEWPALPETSGGEARRAAQERGGVVPPTLAARGEPAPVQ